MPTDPIWIRRRVLTTAAAVVTAATATAVLAACATSASITTPSRRDITWTTSRTTPPASTTAPSVPTSSAPPTSTSDSSERATSAPRSSLAPTVTRLGKLAKPPTADAVGAPFDPCEALSWNRLPEQLRPRAAKPLKPTLRTPRADSVYDIACELALNHTTAVTADGASPGPSGELSVWIVWGPAMSAVPDGATPTTIGPARGALMPSTTPNGSAMCTGTAQLRHGVAGLSVFNGRAPQINTCDLVADLLTDITTEHS